MVYACVAGFSFGIIEGWLYFYNHKNYYGDADNYDQDLLVVQ